MLERDKLIDDCDIEYVLELAGMPIKRKSGYVDTLCPVHDDTNFGSCKVDPQKKTVHCFVCGTHMSVFDVISAKLGYSYFESFKFVAESTGHPEDYIVTEKPTKENKKVFPLTKEDIEMLDLVTGISTKEITALNIEKPDKGHFFSEKCINYSYKKKKITIQELYDNNRFYFNLIVSYKLSLYIKEKKDIYSWLNIDTSFEEWECIKRAKSLIKKLKLESYMELCNKTNAPIRKKIRLVQTSNPALPF